MATKEVLHVRISAASRKNLDAACERLQLGLADVVDRMLSEQQAILTACADAFDRALGKVPAAGAERQSELAELDKFRRPVVRGPQVELPIAKRRGRKNHGK